MKDAKILSSSFTVYCYDRRGRGDSTNKDPYAVEREIEDIEAMIDAAGGSAYLYGHSSGAVLALEAALRLPKKVLKVALFDASYAHDEKEKSEYAGLRKDVQAHLERGKNDRALKTFLIGIGMPKVFVYLLPLMRGWKTMKALAPTLDYDMLLTHDLPPLSRVAEVVVPVYVLYGEKSPEGIHEVARQLGASIPDARLSMLVGQDHMVDAKALLPCLKSFFLGSR